MGSNFGRTLLAALSAALVSTALNAQVRIAEGDYAAVPGFELALPIEIEATQNITGFSFGVSHDPSQLSFARLVASAELLAVADLASEFYVVNEDPDGGDGITVALILDPDSVDGFLPPGTHPLFEVFYSVLGAATGPAEVAITGSLGSPAVELIVDVNGGIPRPFGESSTSIVVSMPFRRGDTNGDNDIEITDAVRILNYRFLGGSLGTCPPTMNVDGSNRDLVESLSEIQIGDAVQLLNYVFLGGIQPAAPFDACGQPSIALTSEMVCRENPGC